MNANVHKPKQNNIEIIKIKVWNDDFYEFVMPTFPSLYGEQSQMKLHNMEKQIWWTMPQTIVDAYCLL